MRLSNLINSLPHTDQAHLAIAVDGDTTMQWLYMEPRPVELLSTAKDAMNILFICSMNKWRSPNGETIFRRREGVHTRSAGTNRKARRQVHLTDIHWADLIFVMEEKHLSRLRADFRDEVKHNAIHVLEIPDDYQFMDPDLVELINDAVVPFLII